MRKWEPTESQTTSGAYYIAKNSETGEHKQFKSFHEMQNWWLTLSIEESLKWDTWDFIY